MSNSILADFRAFLIADVTLFNSVNGRISQAPVDDNEPLPWIGFGRTGDSEEGEGLDGSWGMETTSIDVAVRSADPEEANTIALRLKNYCKAFRGTMGTRTVSYIGATNTGNNDELFPEGTDDRKSTVTVNVEVIHAGP